MCLGCVEGCLLGSGLSAASSRGKKIWPEFCAVGLSFVFEGLRYDTTVITLKGCVMKQLLSL
jgi:hypothetical protein